MLISPWTDERIELLKVLFGRGLSASQIAFELGHATRNAVIGKIHRLGLSRETAKKTAAPRVPRESKISVTRVNSNSHVLRVMPAVEVAQYELKCVEIVPLNVSLLELATDGCHYIPGDDLLYCGHPSLEGKSYCAPHYYLCFAPSAPRKDKAWSRAA